MIQANELRIGNIIALQGQPIKVNFTTLERVLFPNLHYTYKDQYTPIPLTDEWLVRLGFEESRESDLEKMPIRWYKEIRRYGHDDEQAHFWLSCGGGDEYYDIPVHHIKHVHQLQNLFFALTGTELTLANTDAMN